MAKICRIHLAGVGQEVARFNPLTIDLRDPKKAPQDAVVWLRNGGGKTTLISLFYSLFVPNAAYFLGRLNGKGAKIEDFLRPDQVGVVATEWELPSMGTPRRIVGQILLLKKNGDLRRTYFSFFESQRFGFDHLPTLGLAKPAPSVDAFRDTLNEEHRQNPSMELVIEESQKLWISHLADLGLDHDLFRAHLTMNSQEGGATELFQIKTPEAFVKLFLSLVFDEQSTTEFEETLAKFRTKLAENPSYKASIEFGETLLTHLRPFAQEAERQQQLLRDRDALGVELSQLAVSVRVHVVQTKESIESLNRQADHLLGIAKQKDSQRRSSERFARGYEKRAHALRIAETKGELSEAQEVRNSEERQYRILSAAMEHRRWTEARSRLSGIVDSLERLRQEHKPELTELRSLAAELTTSWNRRMANLKADLDLTQEDIKEKEQELDHLRNQRVVLSKSLAEATKERDTAKENLRLCREARRRLTEESVLLPGESGTSAQNRWATEVARFDAQIARLQEEFQTLKARLQGTRSRLAEAQNKLGLQEQAKAAIEAKLGTEAARRANVEKLEIIRETAEGSTPDLRNPFLSESLEKRRDDAHAELIRLAVEGAEDRRDDRFLEYHGLFAPSSDVEEVLQSLSRAGIVSALPMYRWLNEHCSIEEAVERLRRFPTEHAGILIQAPADFALAQTALAAARVRSPIALLRPTDLPKLDKATGEYHTVVPTERGLFSTTEATQSRHSLEERRRQQKARGEQAKKISEDANEAATLIREYLKDFPAERIAELNGALEAAETMIATLTGERDTLTSEVEELEARQSESHAEQLQAQNDRNDAANNGHRVVVFIRDYESREGAYKDTVERSDKICKETDSALKDLAAREPGMKETLQSIQGQAETLRGSLRDVERSATSLPSEYVGDEFTVAAPRSPEELEHLFRSAQLTYEGKIQKTELDGEKKEAEGDVKRRYEVYKKALGNLPERDVEIAAREESVEVAIDRQKHILDEAIARETLANAAHQKALRDAPAHEDFKSEEIDHSRDTQPDTADECDKVSHEYDLAASALRREIEDTREQERVVAERRSKLREALPRYEGWESRLGPPAGALGHPGFTNVAEEDGKLVDSLLKRRDQFDSQITSLTKSLATRFDNEIHPHVHDVKYDKFRIGFRDRLKVFKKDDFVSKASDQITSLSAQIATCRNDLEAEEQERRIIVEKLDSIARKAANLLNQAESVSTMPDAIETWAQLPFLRITVPKKNDLSERQVLLTQAVERWFTSDAIPKGHELALASLLAVCGTKSIGVRILKPEHHMSPVHRDITELVKFSDGEKLTAAIILYCILVRLRAKQKFHANHLSTQDAGMLLLDNPFGKATHGQFVDLQVRMANLMGVQLIYATGISDYEALKHFPHYVRLKNSSRGRASNDYHVTLDRTPLETDKLIEGVVVGKSPALLANGS